MSQAAKVTDHTKRRRVLKVFGVRTGFSPVSRLFEPGCDLNGLAKMTALNVCLRESGGVKNRTDAAGRMPDTETPTFEDESLHGNELPSFTLFADT